MISLSCSHPNVAIPRAGLLVLILAVLLLGAFPASAETDRGRVWSNLDGRTLHAEFISIDRGSVVLKRVDDGRRFTISLDQLSLHDRDYLLNDGPRIDRIRAVQAPSQSDFMHLRGYALAGNLYAVEAINDLAEKLYAGVDPQRDQARMSSNLGLMREVFNSLGVEAARGNDRAFQSLLAAARHTRIRSFVPNALGEAAGLGCKRSLEVLLNHGAYSFPRSSVVSALHFAAAQGEDQAIQFLADVLYDDRARPLWYMASNGLASPARSGHPVAVAALQKYEQDKR